MGKTRVWASLDPYFESGPMLGRIQANRGFLAGLLALDPYDAYHFYLPSLAACEEFVQAVREELPSVWGSGKIRAIHRSDLPGCLSRMEHHVFHLSDCIVQPGFLAALRNACSGQIFPITSVTHSLSYARYGLDFLKHLSPCTTPRDAVVATSETAAGVVRGYYRYLRQSYGLDEAAFPEPAVEHIPLGVDLEQFTPPDELRRARLRHELGFGTETVFLVLARLSHDSKMDFLPVLRAFQRLILEGRQPGAFRLVLAGWTGDTDWGKGVITDLARNVGLPLTVEERPSEGRKWELYAASDVFLSPSDNIQETFGLTLLEAQAMGLPVIASDFDGYRSLVCQDETGILIPTTGPVLTDGVDLMAPLVFDTPTHLSLAQRLAVDVARLARAMDRLSREPAQRRDMGRAARRLASSYGWEAIAARYVELWEDLRARPVPESPASRHPAAVPYASVFGGYPSVRLGEGCSYATSRLGHAVYRGQDFPLVYEGMAGLIDLDAVRALLVLARKPCGGLELADRLRAAMPGFDEERAQAILLWCLKHDLLESSDG